MVFAPLGACLCFLPGRVEAGEVGQSALAGSANLLKTPEMSFWGRFLRALWGSSGLLARQFHCADFFRLVMWQPLQFRQKENYKKCC